MSSAAATAAMITALPRRRRRGFPAGADESPALILAAAASGSSMPSTARLSLFSIEISFPSSSRPFLSRILTQEGVRPVMDAISPVE